ncbi:MAG: T9SS type A sorting domain-containing protein [Bacteroidota bacterium]
MKKVILFIAILISLRAGAQVTLEHTYDGQGVIAHLEFQEEKYALLEASAYRCRIYYANHSLYKTVNLPVPSGVTINSLQHITDGLFNTDALIEFSYTYYLISGSTVVYETRVANENGQVLVTVSGASAAYVDHIGDSWKFIAWIYDYSTTPAVADTKVYSLPGQLVTGTAFPGFVESGKLPYPNPSVDIIILSYKLNDRNDGSMIITSATGQIVRVLDLGPDFDNIQFSVRGLPAGLYHYKVEGGSGSGSFIVG